MLRTALRAAILGLVAHGAAAQQDALENATREDQAALFEAMRAEPDDLDIMFRYALVSIQLQDYEQAIAVLERMLIFNPDLPRVKLELAVAYFRLGAFEVARFYLNDALAANPPEPVVERIETFLAAIEGRTRRNQFSGFVSLGTLYSTNATLGPDDREVTVVNFATGQVGTGTIPADATSTDDFGVRLSAGLTHTYDLGRPNRDLWLSRVGYVGQRYSEEERGAYDVFEASTGPQLSLDDTQFGLRGRPFIRGGFVRSEEAPLYVNGGGGFELSQPLGTDWALFGRLSADYRDYVREEDGFDGVYGAASLSASYTGLQDTRLTATALLETDRADEDFNSNNEIGLRLSALRDVDAPIEIGAGDPWTLTGYVQGSGRFYDDPDPVVDPDETRRDFDGRVGARVFAPYNRTVGVALEASYFERFSNIRNYELDNFEVGVSVIARF